MAAHPVEWLLIVFYGPEAHRAAYGRQVKSDRYTKDYIQLSRKPEFIDAVSKLFAADRHSSGSVPLTFRWPSGSAPGAFVFNSADRPHLKWETSRGAPQVWKMSLTPSDSTAETIPGDPSHLSFHAAENERSLIAARGAGQPYLFVVKLRDQPRVFHLRVYLEASSNNYGWADLKLTPQKVQDLAKSTTQRRALAWANFDSGGKLATPSIKDALADLDASGSAAALLDQLDEGVGKELLTFLRAPGYGLFFDPTRNHDAWTVAEALPESVNSSVDTLVAHLEELFLGHSSDDAVAEGLEVSESDVIAFREQIESQNYKVDDATATVKTRGSAQRAFSESVRKNYGNRCAITGITNRNFLVAAHIVPWSEDHSIRLDPSNGICLSLLVDRAFENGFLLVADDLTISIDVEKIGDDEALRRALKPYDGKKIEKPTQQEPNPEYLRRRRALVKQVS